MRSGVGGLNRRQVGADYEAVAADYLIGQGYKVLERNYRSRAGEVDLIAEKDGVIVYAEIKFRRDGRFGDPLEAVDLRKQRRISRAAAAHYEQWGAPYGKACRFDVIGIYGDGTIRHIENAFDYRG